MSRRKAEASWRGSVRDGSGEVALGSGIWRGPYDWRSRFEDGTTTNPEELLAAAHAGCFTMALAAELSKAGTPATTIDSAAWVTLTPGTGGPEITSIEIETRVTMPGIDQARLSEMAERAKRSCPLSKALAAVPIQLRATLGSAKAA